MQLLPPQIESETIIDNVAWEIPCVEIKDEPAYGYRGMMLDVCRHFHDVEFVKKQLDIMAMFKMNYFHWHLTDDHLWTIEIKKYPRLAEVGSVRRNADGSIHRGFYTQEQIKEVVAYAAERYITVIPEVELPGHALAALTAYPEYSCTGGPFELRNKWGVEDNVYCAGNDKTFEFLQDILEEVIPLFPGKFFHIGGDECPMGDWKKCPDCQAARAKKGQGDNVEAQMSDFTKSLTAMLAKHRKKPILWYDINKSYYHKGETVMSWLPGEFPRCIDKTKEQGIDLIVTPQFKYYLARTQMKFPADDVRARPGGAPILLKDCYNFDPRNGRDKNDVKHIKGINLCMWAEWIPSGELLMYMTYPRAMAVSETAWGSHKNRPSLEEFEKKMETHKKHFQKRFGYTLERTVENKPYREKFITQEEIERINENYKKGQQNADK